MSSTTNPSHADSSSPSNPRPRVSFDVGLPDEHISDTDFGPDEDELHDYYPKSHSQPLDSNSPIRAKRRREKSLTSRDKLRQFFRWNPPVYVKDPTSKSAASRKPRFFDLHLHEELQLKKIVVLPDLPRAIGAVCDGFLDMKTKHVLHITGIEGFPDKEYRDARLDKGDKDIERGYAKESELQAAYRQNLSTYFSTVASTLTFGQPRWEAIFEWSVDPREKQPYARADGFLHFGTSSTGAWRVLPESQQEDIVCIQKHNLHHLAIWEFKSLAAGTEEVMKEVVGLEGDFQWMNCQLGKDNGNDTTQKDNKCQGGIVHDNSGRFVTTGRRTGPDAKERGFLEAAILKKDEAGAVISGCAGMDMEAVQVPEVEYEDMDIERSDSGDMDVDLESGDKPIAGSSSKSTRPLRTAKQEKFRSKKTSGSRSRKEKKTELANSSIVVKRNDTVQASAAKSAPQKPRDIVQQVWAEAVYNDCTLIILSSGNWEIICVRERTTGTLFMSEPIHAPTTRNPGYAKIHTGIYALAYADSLDRARQLEALSGVHEEGWPHLFRLTFGDEAYPNNSLPLVSAVTADGGEIIYQNLLAELASDKILKIRQHRDKGGNQSYHSCHWLGGPTTGSLSSWTLEVHKSLTSRVYSVVAKNGQKHSFSDKLVIKFASYPNQYRELEQEYNLHLHFSAIHAPFSVKVFGIVQFPNSKARGMLMEWSGDSMVKLSRSGKKLLRNNQEKFILALESLHLHGYTHDNDLPEHLLLSKDGKVSIIGYKNFLPVTQTGAETKADPKGKGKAKEDEQSVLDSAQKAELEALKEWLSAV